MKMGYKKRGWEKEGNPAPSMGINVEPDL